MSTPLNLPWLYREKLLHMIDNKVHTLNDGGSHPIRITRRGISLPPRPHEWDYGLGLDAIAKSDEHPYLVRFHIGTPQNYKTLTAMEPIKAFLHLCEVHNVDPNRPLRRDIELEEYKIIAEYTDPILADFKLVFSSLGWPSVSVLGKELHDRLGDVAY